MKKIFIVTFFLICSFILGYLLNSDNGNYERYKIYMNPNVRADQYLLDTKTGVVWHLIEAEKDVLMAVLACRLAKELPNCYYKPAIN